MKDNTKEKKVLGRAGYYSIIAFSIAVIGAVSWFTVSKIGTLGSADKTPESKNKTSYSESDDSYNSSTKQNLVSDNDSGSEDVANSAENVPYEKDEKENEEKNESRPQFTMPVDGAVIKPFSNKTLQYSKTYADMRLHEGIDLKCDEGTQVKSASDGTVTDITDDPVYGKTVVVDHGGGISVKYCGLKNVAVTKGSSVGSGDILGTSGTVPCECKDEPHIHLEAADESGLASLLQLFGISE